MIRPIRISTRAVIEQDGRILLIECQDGDLLHYNLPGGGVDAGESLHEALRREVLEETCAEVDEIRRLLLVYEYVPRPPVYLYSNEPAIAMVFQCTIRNGSEPSMPPNPDKFQIGVRWVALEDVCEPSEAPRAALIPPIGFQIAAALRQFDAWDPLVSE